MCHRNTPDLSCVSGINSFLKETVKNCTKNGYVQTLMGRRRYLPGITNSNTHVKAHVSALSIWTWQDLFVSGAPHVSRVPWLLCFVQAERQAVNTTVQGSAADIVKLATVNIQKRLRQTYPVAPLSHQHTHPGDCIFFSSSAQMCGDTVSYLSL